MIRLESYVSPRSMKSEKMWVRRNPKELRQLQREKQQDAKSPFFAIASALGIALLFTIMWAMGISGKYSQRPHDPKTWSEIQQHGSLLFVIVAAVTFLVLYWTQRRRGRSLTDPEKMAFICPRCFTPQHADDRACGCGEKLEPLENWKWI